MNHEFISSIEEIIEDQKKGKMVIMVDDEDRENEGDLIVPADKIDDKLINFSSVRNFLKKRFFRLYPLHLLFLIIFLIIEVSKYFAQIKYGLVANNEAFSINNLKTFLGNIFLIQTFFDYNTFNTPSWSISAEYYTYMIFALVFFFMKKNNLLIFIF